MEIPLFPLNTVLFPGGPLPLRIFESRYLDMISRCLKHDTAFGVLLIKEGQEAGPASTHEVGTLATVVDWYQGSDGLLGITALGSSRFRLLAADRHDDGLYSGRVELLPDLPSLPLPESARALPHILESVMNDLGRLYEDLERNFEDAVWVAHRFVEILPINLEQKQEWLESEDVLACLHMVEEVLHQ
jgi:Lon protease-like protein